MKKKIFVSIALLALLAACDDHYDDQFNIKPDITDVKDIAMTLETADYGTISKLSANQELALSKDPEGKTYVEALAEVGTNHYFTEEAPAEDYLPAYLKSKYPNADEGSRFVVTYKLFSPSEYMGDFKNLSAYDLTEDDYKTVWGDKVKASFLSPSTVSKIPGLLKAAVNNPAAGDMKVVNYAYSQTEPSIGGGGDGGDEPAPSYTNIADAIKSGVGNYDVKGKVVAANARSFLVQDATGVIMVYLNALPPFSLGDEVTVSGEISSYKGAPFQFSKDAKVTVVNPASAFAYPTNPEILDGAALEAALGSTDIRYVTYEGTLIKIGNYYNVTVDGMSENVKGSIQYPVFLDPALINQKVKITGYLIGQSSTSGFVNTMATSVVLTDGSGTDFTAAGIVSLSPAGTYTVQGVVAGTYTRGFILADATGYAWVYQGESPAVTVAVGDVVTVSGTTSKNAGLMQFGVTSTVMKVGTSTIIDGLKPFEMSAADLDAYVAVSNKYVSYVSYQGKLVKSGNYYNIEIEGASTAIGSIKFPADDLVSGLVDKNVLVKGFLLGVSSDKYVNTMLVSIEEAAAVAGLRSLASTRASSVSPTTSALYVYDGDNNAWKEYTTEEAKVAVVEPGVYESLGTDMIEEPETVLPAYLKQKYPYAAAESVVAVIYNEKANTPVVAEYTLGENWIETTSSRLVTTTFTQDAEGISAEASMYVNETFKKDLGSFTIQDVFMDGVSWVWKQDSYGYMKASAYIKATGNHQAESWLVSPVMNFKKSKEPELLFEHACRFRAENPADHLNVMVSVDYSGDVKTATWTALTVENWSDATDWTFVSNKIDLSAYNGQQVTIAFKYASTNEVAPTWEVKNVVVREKVEGESEGEEGGDAETPAE